MHQRTWLSLLTLPIVTAFTYPVVFQQAQPAPRVEVSKSRPGSPRGALRYPGCPHPGAGQLRGHPRSGEGHRRGDRECPGAGPSLECLPFPRGTAAAGPWTRPGGPYGPQEDHLGPGGRRDPGSPADKAGILVGDVIRKIDGDSIGSMSAWVLERRLKGPVGSEINLVNYDNVSGQLKKLTLKRELVQRPAMAVRKEPKGTLLTLPDLSAGRAAELQGLLGGFDRSLPLVLDLRRCAGGDLAEAIQSGGPAGMSTRMRSKRRRTAGDFSPSSA